MLRRDIVLAGANLMALAGTAEMASAAPGDLADAMGIPGDQVSTDDFVQIQQLYSRYCHALDMGSGDAFASTFTEDGEFTGGRAAGHANDDRTPLKGRQALAQMGSGGGSRHFTANLVVTKTADGAKGSCYLMLYSTRTIPASWMEIAVYDDTLVKTPQGWKFKKRVVWRDDDDISPFKAKPRPAPAKG
jgi:hypothetical protein